MGYENDRQGFSSVHENWFLHREKIRYTRYCRQDFGDGGAPETDAPFGDVSADHWALGAILSAYGSGWVTGYPDGIFGPDRTITRAEAVVIINKILGLRAEGTDGTLSFTDVSGDDWLYQDLLRAAARSAS